MSLLIKAPPAPARVEDVIALPAPSAAHSGRMVKVKSRGASKVYACVQNSNGSYEWNQIAIST
ncbi:hypothetical protein ES708_14968 [subsurface metagenome]